MDSTAPYRLLEVLSFHDVPYVVIGGQAVSYHGFVRATEDVDIVFRRSAESEKALFAARSNVDAH